MNKPLTLALTLSLAAPLAAAQSAAPVLPAPSPSLPTSAQPASQGVLLSAVVVTGANDLLGNFLKASLNVQPGDTISSLDLRQVEKDALATGYFKTVVASLSKVGTQNTLTLAVVPNPAIGAVEVKGLTYFPADAYKARIADLLNIAPGATLNTAKIDQSKELLTQNFRNEGYPFTPSVSTSTTTPAKDGSVTLTYTVDETAPLSRVEVTGNTRLPQAVIVNAFKPLYTAKKFTPDVYFKAAQDIAQAYQAAGYLQSGVDVGATTLQGGVLKVKLSESVVSSVSTTLSAAGVALQTRADQPLTLSALEADVRNLANKTGKSVGFALQPDAQNPSRIAVTFGDAQVQSGPIKEIRFTGNTKVSTAELAAALKLKVGDTFSKQLAESGFFALREAYRAKGYDISTRDPIKFENGVLTYTLREATVKGFVLDWQGPHRTQDRVVLREVQGIQGVVPDTAIRDGIDRIVRLGIVKLTNVTTRSDDPNNPEQLTYVISLGDQTGGSSFSPAIAYDTLNGWQGTLDVTNNNLFGLGHVIRGAVSAQPTDSGQVFGGGISYTIPWLDVDFADFRKTRTGLTVSADSTLTPNNTLLNANNADTGRQYTQRSTGFGLSLGRSLGRNLNGSLGIRSSYNSYYLESIKGSETSNLNDTQATAILPANGRVTTLSTGLAYDSSNSAEFPTKGVRANGNVGYNFGYAGAQSLSWFNPEGGASTYFGFGKLLDKGFAQLNSQQVFAVRVNAGSLVGTPPSSTIFSVGDTNVTPYELRGVPTGTLKGRSYLTSSAEYRYDFGLNSSVIQGLYGIAFIDAGTVWATDGTLKSAYGLGAGLQVNLGLNGSPLAALRFDYGFSPSNNSSKFGFRLGPVW